MEAVTVGTPPRIMEAEVDFPLRKDKGKGVVVPSTLAQADEAGDGRAFMTARQYVHHQARRSMPIPATGPQVLVKVGPSLEGLNPHFRLDVLVSTCVEGCNENFKRRGIDP